MRSMVFAVIAGFPVGVHAAETSLQFGLATVDRGAVCLEAADLPLPGSTILLVDPDTPQKTHVAKVLVLARCGTEPRQAGARRARIGLSSAPEDQVAPMIAVIGTPARVTTLRGQVTVSPHGSRPPFRFRRCASVDGLHFTVWAGAPLRSPRAWHRYVYLNQDLEPDCKAADTR